MAVITIFSGAFCRGDQVAELLSQSHGLELVPDEAVTLEASKRFQISQDKFHCALSGETSVFNRFTHERSAALHTLRESFPIYWEAKVSFSQDLPAI